jgi:glucuronate isomerase
MLQDRLAQVLYSEICQIPIIDPHSHIDPRKPAARSLDEILGYHYYTELAHSVGMEEWPLGPEATAQDRVRAIVYHMDHFDNTAQYEWFLEIARAFFNFQGSKISLGDCARLCDTAERLMAQPGWEERLLAQSNVEKVFLTNEFDDRLEGFNTARYVPCLRTDSLVFELHEPNVRRRLVERTGTEVSDWPKLQAAVHQLFEYFVRRGAKACAISLPPEFSPRAIPEPMLSAGLQSVSTTTSGTGATGADDLQLRNTVAQGVFWLLADCCREFKLPFDLMIGVTRKVYRDGVAQGQDLFDQRTSLMQYAELFNSFPEVDFCISILSSGQNQELASYSWIFPNVYTMGHWWYSNIPAYIAQDLRARLQAVPKTKQIGYYSDAYKLEFALPKFNMYRRILAQVLADDYVKPRIYTESQALELARFLLRTNVQRIFNV